MSEPIVTYLHDHLAGARFAVTLLDDLSGQKVDQEVALFAAELRPEIEADRSALVDLIRRMGEEAPTLKDIAAWVAQKAGRFKLDLHEPMGLFEAIETLSLGVLGKLALWNALKVVQDTDPSIAALDLDGLIGRARDQHQRFESLRLRLAIKVFNSQL